MRMHTVTGHVRKLGLDHAHGLGRTLSFELVQEVLFPPNCEEGSSIYECFTSGSSYKLGERTL